MFSVLITDRFAAAALERLRAQAGIEVSQILQGEATDLTDVDALLIRSRTKIDEWLLKTANRLKIIITSTSGFDHIDLDLCTKKNIKVCYTPEANAQSAAEMTWALITACMRKTVLGHEMVKQGNWDRTHIVGHELYKKTLGLIGLGRVGQRVAKIARAFDMHVLACDPYVDEAAFSSTGAHRCGREEVLKSSDIVSLHVPLTKETRNLINLNTLEDLSRGAILINTSRGQVVNEQALVEYLKTGKISAAGLDVFEKEPLLKTSALASLPNVVLTPHIGANTHEAFERGSQAAVDKILAFRQGEKVCDQLTKEQECQQ